VCLREGKEMSRIDKVIRRNQARRKQPKYSCVYISGDGKENEGGIWRKQDRPQTITFVCIKKPFFDLNWEKLVIHKDPAKNRNPLKDWEDGSYTIYPYQCGTPYIFTPIKKGVS
jgi:hypothetical protein